MKAEMRRGVGRVGLIAAPAKSASAMPSPLLKRPGARLQRSATTAGRQRASACVGGEALGLGAAQVGRQDQLQQVGQQDAEALGLAGADPLGDE